VPLHVLLQEVVRYLEWRLAQAQRLLEQQGGTRSPPSRTPLAAAFAAAAAAADGVPPDDSFHVLSDGSDSARGSTTSAPIAGLALTVQGLGQRGLLGIPAATWSTSEVCNKENSGVAAPATGAAGAQPRVPLSPWHGVSLRAVGATVEQSDTSGLRPASPWSPPLPAPAEQPAAQEAATPTRHPPSGQQPRSPVDAVAAQIIGDGTGQEVHLHDEPVQRLFVGAAGSVPVARGNLDEERADTDGGALTVQPPALPQLQLQQGEEAQQDGGGGGEDSRSPRTARALPRTPPLASVIEGGPEAEE
jgi:hypothetical protein